MSTRYKSLLSVIVSGTVLVILGFVGYVTWQQKDTRLTVVPGKQEISKVTNAGEGDNRVSPPISVIERSRVQTVSARIDLENELTNKPLGESNSPTIPGSDRFNSDDALTRAGTIDGGYVSIDPPADTESGDKIEVVAFFWYGCNECFQLESRIQAWLQHKPESVVFRRVPVLPSPSWSPHARYYFAVETLGVAEKMHQSLFRALHEENQHLMNKGQLVRFAVRLGVNEAEFRLAWDSFSADLNVHRARQLAKQYKVVDVPALGINGKYRTDIGMVESYSDLMLVLEKIIRKEKAVHPPNPN